MWLSIPFINYKLHLKLIYTLLPFLKIIFISYCVKYLNLVKSIRLKYSPWIYEVWNYYHNLFSKKKLSYFKPQIQFLFQGKEERSAIRYWESTLFFEPLYKSSKIIVTKSKQNLTWWKKGEIRVHLYCPLKMNLWIRG